MRENEYSLTNPEFNSNGEKILTREEWNEHMRGRQWADFTVVNQISDKYYTEGRTGAEAIICFWKDIGDGKINDICSEFNIPNPMGLIHGVNTMSKHYVLDGILNVVQGKEKWRASPIQD